MSRRRNDADTDTLNSDFLGGTVASLPQFTELDRLRMRAPPTAARHRSYSGEAVRWAKKHYLH
jgi:hypothetical protein